MKPLILLADDNPSVRRLMSIVLPAAGFDLLLAADGQEALALYRARGEQVALVVLDVDMPILGGPDALAALRELNPNIHCCFITGGCSDPGLLDRGAAQVFYKPFDLAHFTQSLHHLIERRRNSAA